MSQDEKAHHKEESMVYGYLMREILIKSRIPRIAITNMNFRLSL